MFPVRLRFLVVILLSAIVLAGRAAAAETPQTEFLWPDGAPGAQGDEAKDKPTLIIYLPTQESANGAGVVICPGGGYGNLAMGHEGHDIARWLNSLGVAAFICDYRHFGKGYRHPAPLQDAQRAIRTVRARAKEWNVDPQRIGILGFSAGGHLASTVSTQFDLGDASSADPVARYSARPDFAILCYPVIAFGQPYTHQGSQRNLIGADADPELVRQLSSEKQVTPQTPPTFLWHTAADTAVPPENSIHYFRALQSAKVPAELHVFARGGHGAGLAARVPGTAAWPTLCQKWLATNGWLAKPTE